MIKNIAVSTIVVLSGIAQQAHAATVTIEAEDSTYSVGDANTFINTGYLYASSNEVLRGNGNAWSNTITPGLSGLYDISVRVRWGYGSAETPGMIGDYTSLTLNGNPVTLVTDMSTYVHYYDEENYVWRNVSAPLLLSAADELVLSSSWGQGFADVYTFTSVPEPTVVGMASVAMAGLLLRRRR